MRNLLAVLVLAVLAGCATVNKMETGPQNIGERLTFHLDGAWNHVALPNQGPAQTWTMEGLPVDTLLIYSGLKDGQPIHGPGVAGQKSFNFQAKMQPDEIVALFEGFLSRDGSEFRLLKLEPSTFGGEKGFRFEYALTRKADGVTLSGFGWDYGGSTSPQSGALSDLPGDCILSLRFSPQDYPADVDTDSVMSDREIVSDNPILDAMDVRVDIVSIGYPHPDFR